MPGKSLVRIDTIRTLGFAGIGAVYAVVGSALAVNARIICITNNTDGDLYFTIDNTVDQLFLPVKGFKVIDFQANMNAQFDDRYVGAVGWQFYVKRITAPTTGAVYIEVFY
jgi:hypothetical protein